MNAQRWQVSAGGLITAVLAWLLLSSGISSAQEKKDKLNLDKIPRTVMDALKARFPKAEIRQWTKEKEGDDIIYDIEFTEGDRKCEADIKENGVYINFEREIAAKDLPKAVRKTLDTRYPKATLQEVMEITGVKGKAEMLEGYEITLRTADNRNVEVTIAPDGKIVEDSGAAKEGTK